MLFSMAVIELAKPGQEAITYELIVSVANAALTVTVVLATQLLAPFQSVTCDCAVDATSSQGPKYWRMCAAADDDDGGGDDGGGDDDGEGQCEANQVNTYSQKTYENTDGPAHFTNYSLVCMVSLSGFHRILVELGSGNPSVVPRHSLGLVPGKMLLIF